MGIKNNIIYWCLPESSVGAELDKQLSALQTNRQGRDPYQYIWDPKKKKASIIFIQIHISIQWASPLQMIAALHFQPEDKMPGTNNLKKPIIFTDLLK